MNRLIEFQKNTYNLEYVLNHRRVVVSVNIVFFKMMTIFMHMIDRDVETEINVYQFEEDGSFSIKNTKKSMEYSMFEKILDETSADNKKMVKKCKQFVERETHSMMLSQIDFKSTLKRLDGNSAKITNLFLSLIHI